MAGPDTRLSRMRAVFVTAYVNNGFNAAEAARTAKYKQDDQAAHRLLRDPEIRAAITKIVNVRARKFDISGEAVLKQAAAIAFADIRDVIRWDGESYALVPSDCLSDAAAAAIEKVEVREYLDGSKRTTVTMAKKAPFLRILARHTGVEPIRGGDVDTLNLNVLQSHSEVQIDLRQQTAEQLVAGLNQESLLALAERAMREIDAIDVTPTDA